MSANHLPIFPIADSFGVPVTITPEGALRGHKKLSGKIGSMPWDTDCEVVSDYYDDPEVGVFTKIKKRLWAYMTVGPGSCKLYLFDSYKAVGGDGIKLDFMERVRFLSKGGREDTLAGLQSSIVAAFDYDTIGRKWKPSHVEDFSGNLVQRPKRKGSGGAKGSPQN